MIGTTEGPGTLRFHVEGLTRPSCAAKVERAIGQLPGVRASHVDYRTGQLVVEAAATVAPEAIAEAGTASGHPTVIAAGGALSRCEWAIEGMDCADCARKIDLN